MSGLIDELLAEQGRLQTPVARFSRGEGGSASPALAPVYRDLIPLSVPAPGEQYAFEVNLDACTGCKACVAACHSLNGLDEHESWRDTGLLVGDDDGDPFQQVVTTACHHCEDPGCLHGCPVLAYEKDPVTGIVRHLDDQCIGCQYCVLKCPYDVPRYSARLGIVRKCDLCHSRLGAGEAPACVQACPTHAIRVVTVETTACRQVSRSEPDVAESGFLPGAPDPSYTRPTTRYVSRRRLPDNLRAADADLLRPQPAHGPLVAMLVLTQASVGVLGAGVLGGRRFGGSPDVEAASALALAAAGLAASVLHLGQPLKAWRCFLGLRRSWLSREVVVFGGYFLILGWLALRPTAGPAIQAAALAAGLAGVFCSAMVYADTRRRGWRLPVSAGKFFGTTAVCGLAVVAPSAAALALADKLLLEASALRGTEVAARLARGPLRGATGIRFALGAGAALALGADSAWMGCALLVAGEMAERYLFFRAVDAPKMPGLPVEAVTGLAEARS